LSSYKKAVYEDIKSEVNVDTRW